MHIDIAIYEANKRIVIDWFNTRGGKDIRRTIGMMASVTFVPCIVIAYWLGEETNWDPEAIQAIKGLIDFYGYTKIDNKPPGSPI